MNTADSTTADRIPSIDIVRGLACVLMAIDHVRVYSGLPAGGPTAAIFLTRWVTHFVAPAFCFLAGTGAFFLGERLNNSAALRKFLVTRGLLLVVLELTVIRILWSFNPNLSEFSLAGVIWMLGWCMVLLGLVVGLPAKRIGWIGVGMVVLQQLFSLPPRALHAIAPWWAFLYTSTADAPFGVHVLYVIVPWIGVMMAGFGCGAIMKLDDIARRRILLRIGLSMTAAFLILATVVAIVRGSGNSEASGGDGGTRPLWMLLLDQQKYPASQLFLLMTLGPVITLLAYAESWRGVIARALGTFGRVPMWYYMMHLLVIHSAALVVTYVKTGAVHNDWFANAPYTNIPPDGRWTLCLLYLVWAICVTLLYPVCQWYAARKAHNPAPWMTYI